MSGEKSRDNVLAVNDVQEIIAYLDRRAWNIVPGLDEEAFRHVLGTLTFSCLLELIGFVRANAKPFSPAFFYRAWLEHGNEESPVAYAAWFNLGVELADAGNREEAATAYTKALTLKPDLYVATVNLGLSYEARGRDDEALEVWRRGIQPDEARTALLNHRGRLLEQCGRLAEAERELFRSLLTVPDQKDAFSHWLYIRMKICQWPVYRPGIPGLPDDALARYAGGLSLLALFDDNDVVNRWVEGWMERKMPAAPVRLSPENGYAHDRIRVGFLSSDYNLHPVSMLIAEMLETLDRKRFEVFGYCVGRDDGSDLRARVLAAFDHWSRLAGMSDEQAARTIRADEVDILVDLNGLTEGTRLGIVRWRPAPVQVTYLGFVGSLPVPELDYAIVDRRAVPPEQAHNFHPKPLYMPRCYQVNDTKAPVAPLETREAVGLPADRFIYCSFSNTYKISEEIFDCWMRILAGVEGSVLWVLSRNQWSQENMRKRAALHGIAADRLIFAEGTSPAKYLSRLRLADVFLDTFPYNSGTTASDALRMGLPIVTLSGKTFSSRMAASLLHAIGLPEGITTSYDAYVAQAIRLGTDRALHERFRAAVAGDAWRRTIGNIEAFMPEFEEALASIRLTPA